MSERGGGSSRAEGLRAHKVVQSALNVPSWTSERLPCAPPRRAAFAPLHRRSDASESAFVRRGRDAPPAGIHWCMSGARKHVFIGILVSASPITSCADLSLRMLRQEWA